MKLYNDSPHLSTAELADPGAPVYFPQHPVQWDLGDRKKRLIRPYRYEWKRGGVHYRMTAPAGFEHDGASVPPIVWSLLPPHSMDRAAVSHDLPYRRAGRFLPGEWEWLDNGLWKDVDRPMRRIEGDLLFRSALFEDPKGPCWPKAQAAFLGLLAAGWVTWRRRSRMPQHEREINELKER